MFVPFTAPRAKIWSLSVTTIPVRFLSASLPLRTALVQHVEAVIRAD